MANYWKVGSRWSDYGDPKNSLLRIFRRNGVVFIGQKNRLDRFGTDVHKDDFFAVADGVTIVAVAKALEEPMPLAQMIKEGIIRFRKTDMIDEHTAEEEFVNCGTWEDQPIGVRVHWVDCKSLDYNQGTFHAVGLQSVKDYIDEQYQAGSTTDFDIKSSTYTLCKSNGKESIIDSVVYFNIPVYQREYSWQSEQVSRFVRDIYNSYDLQEAMFIGTMQLSAPKVIEVNREYEQDIIDGQQRLSTLFCFLRYLQLKYPENAKLKELRMDWLETRVNNGKENELLDSLKELNSLADQVKMPNRYVENARTIADVFEEQLHDENGNSIELDVDSFVDFLTHKLYFVVIETHSGLSKTIRIFNTINTAGLDLNGDDLFKVRFFEYLKDCCNGKDSDFDEISKFYGEVKDINQKWRAEGNGEDLVSIQEIRDIYKDYIISRYDLNTQAMEMSTDRFFEFLFDHLLNVQRHYEEFGKENIGKVKLSLEDLKNVLQVETEWNRHCQNYDTTEQYVEDQMLWYSRYWRHRRIAYQAMLKFNQDPDKIVKTHQILSLVSRIAYCQSLRFAKIVGEANTKIKNAYYNLYTTDGEKTIPELKDYLSSVAVGMDYFIKQQIFEDGKCHRTWGELICVLSTCLTEVDANKSIKWQELKDILYRDKFDLEHIHATNDKVLTDVPVELQNSIGNLMLLEYDINRSIGNKVFKDKCPQYEESRFATVQRIRQSSEWGEEQIKQRLEQETQAIEKWIISVL